MAERTALIAARKAKGLNQAQLGAKVGLSQSGISRLEAGEFVPDAAVARALIDELGITLDEVIGEPIDATPPPHDAA